MRTNLQVEVALQSETAQDAMLLRGVGEHASRIMGKFIKLASSAGDVRIHPNGLPAGLEPKAVILLLDAYSTVSDVERATRQLTEGASAMRVMITVPRLQVLDHASAGSSGLQVLGQQRGFCFVDIPPGLDRSDNDRRLLALLHALSLSVLKPGVWPMDIGALAATLNPKGLIRAEANVCMAMDFRLEATIRASIPKARPGEAGAGTYICWFPAREGGDLSQLNHILGVVTDCIEVDEPCRFAVVETSKDDRFLMAAPSVAIMRSFRRAQSWVDADAQEGLP